MLGNHSHTIWTVVSDNTVWGQNMSTCEEKEDVSFKPKSCFKQKSFADYKHDNYIVGKTKREKERCNKRKFNWLAITDKIRKKDKRRDERCM